MAGYRIDRISEDIKREISAVIRELKDPRVASKMLSVVRAEVSGDLSYAKIYVSAIEGIEVCREAVKGLRAASGYVRRELGIRLSLRKVPELRFVADDSIAYGARISNTLSELGLDDADERGNDDYDQ
ncbi:MAG: 30S ribosome-binding factor RbfA [Clostridia bacterium]|nr:30S ribosome-binding factor RbfA [Clostridia bacterium]